MKKYILEITVFFCGAVIMAYELVGSRILAPYMGNSIYTWASIIGVIMGSLSLGYWFGGYAADKNANYRDFSLIIFLSAITVGLTVFIKEPILALVKVPFWGIELASIISSLVLFSPPSFLLGIISPYSVKLKMNTLEKSGATVGNLYAISTLGSIVGTFLAGFVLIPHLGTNNNIIFLFAILLLLSIFVYSKNFLFSKFIFLFLFIIFFLAFSSIANAYSKNVDVDSQYNRILIYKSREKITGREILNLQTDPYGIQSAMYTASDELVAEYLKYFRLAEHFSPKIQKTLMIGGSAYAFPKYFLKKYPHAQMDVVEIDPKMTALAKEYFNLKDDARLKIFHEDGRVFLNQTTNKYDIIYVDAFNSFASIPFQLTTIEAVENEFNLLNDNGAIIINAPGAASGNKDDFLLAELATYRKIFPQVYLFQVNNKLSANAFQNYIIVAVKSSKKFNLSSKDKIINGYLRNSLEINLKKDQQILTDDFAPIEYLVKKAF